MTREEVQDLLAMIQATYPNYNPINKTIAVNAWTMALGEYEKDLVAIAFKAYMQTNTSGFAPSPGQIIERICSFTKEQELNEMEAWALVRKAIRNSAYNFDLEFSKLPPLVQKCVGLPKQLYVWATDENYNEQVVSSNFIKCYRSESLKEKELSSISSSLKRIANNAPMNPYSAHISTLRENSIKYLDDKEKSEIDGFKLYTHGVPMPNKAKERLNEIFKTE